MFKATIFQNGNVIAESVYNTLSATKKAVNDFSIYVVNKEVIIDNDFITTAEKLTAKKFANDIEIGLHLENGIDLVYGVGIGYDTIIKKDIVTYDLEITPLYDFNKIKTIEKKNKKIAIKEITKTKKAIATAQKINAKNTAQKEKTLKNIALLKKHGLI